MTLIWDMLNRSRKAEILFNIDTKDINRFFGVDDREKSINLLISENAQDNFWKYFK